MDYFCSPSLVGQRLVSLQDQRVYQGQRYVDDDVGHHSVVAGFEEASFPPEEYDGGGCISELSF